ncbi:META domain-containing protein [Flavobacterium hibernum]|uniref:Heat-shock protein n=1 Tax=Flavobacterium hibernum TaxID=37752 RepID=A0A0D0EWG9_9FLAO|nr:META domain-containing protein [Flavobacterium hibernum]KIO51396.1 heat-shock protein [Flavobacterium hibernum]OXA84192.1 heat-shock protein [Flavobacterium hibernum]STO10992.1 Predicted membrane protein [Flavobacterium hibernum]
MKKVLLLCVLAAVTLSCKSVAVKNSNMEETTSKTTSDEEDLTVYFKATGNEPFWGLKIGKDKTVFTSLIEGMESISFKSVEPIRAMDANVKMYKLNNGKTSATVTIQQFDCQDSMSGEKSPYTVKVEINGKILNGCGKYITDYRLHDIWVLEELNGKKVSLTDFQRELPRIEIHAAENRFMGFGGCNSISGSIFYEKDLLRFSNMISTLMACAPGNKEDEFTKALQSTTTYTVGNNRLTLSNPSGKLLVFKKVD